MGRHPPALPPIRGSADCALMVRIASGDPAVLGQLHDHYGHVIFGVLFRMLGTPEAPEEVAQDTSSLAFWARLSHSEIAEQTGVPLGTVKSRGDSG